jgi:CTP synthase (UTP-ammonia lyase)
LPQAGIKGGGQGSPRITPPSSQKNLGHRFFCNFDAKRHRLACIIEIGHTIGLILATHGLDATREAGNCAEKQQFFLIRGMIKISVD